MAVNRTELLQSILERLRERGARMTKKRERLLGALLTMDRPASAEEIRERAGFPDSDLVTVYRNMEVFESLGVLQKVPLENGSHLFELTGPDDHYHHLICRECHRTERLKVCITETVKNDAMSRGFSEITHVLEVYGICSLCAAD